MLDANTIDAIANEIIRQMQKGSAPAGQRAPQGDAAVPAPLPAALQSGEKDAGEMEDITSAAQKAVPTLQSPEDYDALIRMKGRTCFQ